MMSIATKDRSTWNPVTWFKLTYVLTPFRECQGNIHRCDDGKVEFTRDREWWHKSAPWVARATRLLAAGLRLGIAGMPLALGSEAADAVKNETQFMEALTDHLELQQPDESRDPNEGGVLSGPAVKDLRGRDSDTVLARSDLNRLLKEVAPRNYEAKVWGSLRRVPMPDNTHRWQCAVHAAGRR